MTVDVPIFGVLLPAGLVMAAVALALLLIIRRVLVRSGFYDLVWQPALADFAIFVILLSAMHALYYGQFIL